MPSTAIVRRQDRLEGVRSHTAIARDDISLAPRLDDDLGVALRIGEIGERCGDAVDADGGGHQRRGIDLPFRDQAQRMDANSSGV